MAELRSRKLAVILHADVVGSTAHAHRHEALAHDRISGAFNAFSEVVAAYSGTVREIRGDALVAEFSRASDAVVAAIAAQQSNQRYIAELDGDVLPVLRVGIALGEVVIADGTITGPGVVLAQRLEQIAPSGGVCISAAIHEATPSRFPISQNSLGPQNVKGFDEPVLAYSVALTPGEAVPHPEAPYRFPSARKATYWWSAGLVAAVVAIAWLVVWTDPRQPLEEPAAVENMALPLPQEPSIAVLPFANLSGDANQEYFNDGLTANLITTLSQLPDIVVIARDSTVTYRDDTTPIGRVAEELGIRYVLKGSSQRSAETVRVHAQLIDALTGHHLWAEKLDRPWSDVFALQDDITEAIVDALEITLTAEQRARLAARYTSSVEAYERFLRGQTLFFSFTPEGNSRARDLFLEAIDLDPEFARAHSAVAFTYDQEYLRDRRPQALSDGLRHARMGVALGGDLPHTHVALGRIATHRGDTDEAIRSLERAIELDANFADAYAQLAAVYIQVGRAEKSLELIGKAGRLNPHHGAGYDVQLGRALYYLRRYDDAASPLERAVEANPSRIRPRLLLAATYAQLGRDEDAEWEIDEVSTRREGATIQTLLASWYEVDEYLEHLADGLRKAGLPE